MNFESGLKDVIRAVDFAAVKHRNQRRKDEDQTPYINHPIGVANILVTEGKITDPDVLQAALLHDTVEDTDTSFDELEKEFGMKVKSIVAEVSDDKSLPYQTRKKLQIEHAATCSYEAKLVKLADKLYNLRDLLRCQPTGWSEKKVDDYFNWAAEVVKQMVGTNAGIENELQLVFNRKGIQLNAISKF